MASEAPVPSDVRKRVLRVLFISLLLDLVTRLVRSFIGIQIV